MNPIVGKENLLEKLLVMGRVREEVDIFGQKVVMQVLDSGEQQIVFEVTSNLDTLARMRAIKHQTLARAIMAINGQNIVYVAKNKDEKIDSDKIVQQNLETCGYLENLCAVLKFWIMLTMRHQGVLLW